MHYWMAIVAVCVIAGGVPWACSAKAVAGQGTKTVLQPDIIGYWYTEHKEAGVELYPCAQSICGRFRWLSPDGGTEEARDSQNPNETLRTRPLCAMQFMGEFQPAAQGRYENGWVYSPEHGATFDAEIHSISHDAIELRGYLLVPAFGDSQIWTRDMSMPDCAQPAKVRKKTTTKKDTGAKDKPLKNSKIQP